MRVKAEPFKISLINSFKSSLIASLNLCLSKQPIRKTSYKNVFSQRLLVLYESAVLIQLIFNLF